MRRPSPPFRRPLLTRVLLLSLALLGLAARPAQAQIVHRSRGWQDTDNRRAAREARRLESPYKESHLKPGRRLKRGQGDRPAAETGNQLRFENGNHPRVVEPKFPALRHPRRKGR